MLGLSQQFSLSSPCLHLENEACTNEHIQGSTFNGLTGSQKKQSQKHSENSRNPRQNQKSQNPKKSVRALVQLRVCSPGLATIFSCSCVPTVVSVGILTSVFTMIVVLIFGFIVNPSGFPILFFLRFIVNPVASWCCKPET